MNASDRARDWDDDTWLKELLANEPPVEPPADLVPSVMALVRADLARARRNARLALAGAVAALVAFAFGVTFFDVIGGAVGLGQDLLSWAQLARDYAPSAPELPALDLPAIGYGWAALALATVIVLLEVRFLAARRPAA